MEKLYVALGRIETLVMAETVADRKISALRGEIVALKEDKEGLKEDNAALKEDNAALREQHATSRQDGQPGSRSKEITPLPKGGGARIGKTHTIMSPAMPRSNCFHFMGKRANDGGQFDPVQCF